MSEELLLCPSCLVPLPPGLLARARSIPPADLIARARRVLEQCMDGMVDPKTGEVQRKAALDILSEDYLKHLSDEALVAELERRHKGAGLTPKQAPK